MAENKTNPLEDPKPQADGASTPTNADAPQAPDMAADEPMEVGNYDGDAPGSGADIGGGQDGSTRTGCSPWMWLLGILVIIGVFIAAYFFFRHEEGDAAERQAREMAAQEQIDSLNGGAVDQELVVPDPEVSEPVTVGEEAAETPGDVAVVTEPDGSVEQLAHDVVRGKYGNEPSRHQRLGHKFRDVQRRVNQLVAHNH